ncbi:uroporphyrinogen decarboxylase (URO-D) [Oxobacter pfennigii]|uniref:Uroporphyrinogen decarboxylase (URO-D) n=1 Tax=Oxobacter pfennigii TaxID=36849 RepID=A0A0P9AB83_9CLOT|nr:uroporphyrinogen decarboxylase family protein [Oxobacter pfennigii]KPU42318.1 uroporphyrinogen decarboxylase (URO-D) [Oxobacter pfennigii]
MSDAKALQQERTEIFQDVYDNKIPKRVPINIAMGLEPTAQFGGIDMTSAQWKPSMVAEAADKLCQTVFSDVCVFSGSLRLPSFYQSVDSQSFVMGSNGFIQHPEVIGMDPEDYDYLIEKPYDCLLERVIPRQYKALDINDPIRMAINLTKSFTAYNNDMMELGMIRNKLVEKYGYYPGGPITAGGFTEAAFDFLADQLRSFRGVSMDVRRMRDKVKAACEALYPIVFKKGLPSSVSNYTHVFFPLHMPTFMREKDFAELWWPTFKRHLEEYASLGVHSRIFCEDNWDRYVDYLYELPTDTYLYFEYGTPKLIKEKLGKKFILSGFYPVGLLKTGTKQQVIDKAKEIIDIMAPGGKYIFTWDKNPLTINDINIDNLVALTDFVRDYAVYQNPGQKAGMEFNTEDYKIAPSKKLESKYFTTWDQFKSSHPEVSDLGEPKLQGLEERVFQFLMYLLL